MINLATTSLALYIDTHSSFEDRAKYRFGHLKIALGHPDDYLEEDETAMRSVGYKLQSEYGDDLLDFASKYVKTLSLGIPTTWEYLDTEPEQITQLLRLLKLHSFRFYQVGENERQIPTFGYGDSSLDEEALVLLQQDIDLAAQRGDRYLNPVLGPKLEFGIWKRLVVLFNSSAQKLNPRNQDPAELDFTGTIIVLCDMREKSTTTYDRQLNANYVYNGRREIWGVI